MNKKYDIIYADPPWFYSKRSTERKTKFRGGARAHYILMRDDEIKALPVSDIASTNCALFLWAVAPKLDDAIDVMRAWGFDYREMYVWEKLNHKSLTPVFAPGYYMRPACEFLLMGIRGRMVPKTHSQSGLVRLPRQRHSEKPSLFRELLSDLFEDKNSSLSKIELFCRGEALGWDVWGNEAVGERKVELFQGEGDINDLDK